MSVGAAASSHWSHVGSCSSCSSFLCFVVASLLGLWLVDGAKCLFVLVDWIGIRVVVGRSIAAVGATAAGEVRSGDMVVCFEGVVYLIDHLRDERENTGIFCKAVSTAYLSISANFN
jgi:hypothetical protein